MKIVMLIDLLITLTAAVIGAMRWSKVGTAWKLVIAGAWVILFGSLSKTLATYGVIADAGWGVTVAGIPIIMVLYVCGSEILILLGIWKSIER
jgi:hypothetical protein